jgi:hypothetical protein
MLDLLTQPIVLLGLVLIILGIIVISVMISKRRSREIEELEQFLPGGELDDIEKIPVEKVRRATRRREQRKQQLHQIPRSPREDVLEIEDLEIVPEELLPPQEENSAVKENSQYRSATTRQPISQGVQDRESSSSAMNRQLYKRNILADKKNESDSLETPTASSSMRTSQPVAPGSQMRPNMPPNVSRGMQRGMTQPRMPQGQNPDPATSARPSAGMRMNQTNQPVMNRPRPTGSEETTDPNRPKTPIRRRIQ